MTISFVSVLKHDHYNIDLEGAVMSSYIHNDTGLHENAIENPDGKKIRVRDLPNLLKPTFGLNLFIEPHRTCNEYNLTVVFLDTDNTEPSFVIPFITVPVPVPFCSIHINEINFEEHLTERQLDSLLFISF